MISAAVVILTAGYILWAIQRVYLGAEYKGPHGEALTPITFREFSIAAPLLALAIFFGVNPQALLNYMQPSVDKTVIELTDWTKTHDKPRRRQNRPPRRPKSTHNQIHNNKIHHRDTECTEKTTELQTRCKVTSIIQFALSF